MPFAPSLFFSRLVVRFMPVFSSRMGREHTNSNTGGRRLVLLVDGNGVEVVLLLELSLDHLDDGAQVWRVLLLLGPLGLGEQSVGDGALHRPANTENTVVTLLFVQTRQSGLHGLGLLGDQVIGAVKQKRNQGAVSLGSGGGHLDDRIKLCKGGSRELGDKREAEAQLGGGELVIDDIPETQLAVACGVGVPVGEGLEGAAQPGALGDKGSEGDVGHDGRAVGWSDRVAVVVGGVVPVGDEVVGGEASSK